MLCLELANSKSEIGNMFYQELLKEGVDIWNRMKKKEWKKADLMQKSLKVLKGTLKH